MSPTPHPMLVSTDSSVSVPLLEHRFCFSWAVSFTPCWISTIVLVTTIRPMLSASECVRRPEHSTSLDGLLQIADKCQGWMTIPYLAIVSCAMLASNSPSALSGIVYDGGSSASKKKFDMSFWDQLKEKAKSHSLVRAFIKRMHGYELIEHTYEGQFRTVPIWNRGPNKRRWVQEAIAEYEIDYNARNKKDLITPEQVRKGLKMKITDMLSIAAGTMALLMAPTVLAFLTSYNTPRKALSCRTLTYLVYGITQVCEMALWVWEAHLKVKYGPRWSNTKTPAKAINWWCQVFVGIFAIVAAVGGTFMQLLGVYRACACRVRRAPSTPDTMNHR